MKKRILLYGTGAFAVRFLPFTERMIENTPIELLGFINSNPEKRGRLFSGCPIYAPGDLERLEYDAVYIFNEKQYGEIYRVLQEECRVPACRVGGFLDLLAEAQRYRREGMEFLQTRPPRIYDCFPFFNEYEILRIRMEVLAPYVDRFVLVEMDRDHRGREKPLHFREHRDDYAEFSDKIVYVRPEELPSLRGPGDDGFDWTLENFQRNCIALGLTDAQPEDVICISDCDEIINPEILRELRAQSGGVGQSLTCKALDVGALAMDQTLSRFYFNSAAARNWRGSILVKYKNLPEPQLLRELRGLLPYVRGGGWHLSSFLPTIEKVALKFSSIADGPASEMPPEQPQRFMRTFTGGAGGGTTEFDMRLLAREEITFPNAEAYTERYPQFYYRG